MILGSGMRATVSLWGSYPKMNRAPANSGMSGLQAKIMVSSPTNSQKSIKQMFSFLGRVWKFRIVKKLAEIRRKKAKNPRYRAKVKVEF